MQERWSETSQQLQGYFALLTQDGSRADVEQMLSTYESQAGDLVEWCFGVYQLAPTFFAENSDECYEVRPNACNERSNAVQRSVSLFEEIRRRIPQLTESYQRLIAQYQQLHTSNLADAANAAMAVEVYMRFFVVLCLVCHSRVRYLRRLCTRI